jgi:hypothetical protein
MKFLIKTGQTELKYSESGSESERKQNAALRFDLQIIPIDYQTII